MKKAKKSGRGSNSDLNLIEPGNAATLKMYEQEDVTPAWYKNLKKNVK